MASHSNYLFHAAPIPSFFLILGFFIDIYVGLGLGSIGEDEDKDVDENTGGKK